MNNKVYTQYQPIQLVRQPVRTKVKSNNSYDISIVGVRVCAKSRHVLPQVFDMLRL